MLGLNQRPPPYQDGATSPELIRFGAQSRIRTDGFRVLQTLALGLSAICALAVMTGFEPVDLISQADGLANR